MIGNFDSGILHALLQRIFYYGEYWLGADHGFGLKENLFTFSLVRKPLFEMVYDAWGDCTINPYVVCEERNGIILLKNLNHINSV